MTGLLTRERDALLAAIRRATLAMKAATAEGAFEMAMERLGRLLHERHLERRYNPNWPSQPRVPRGNRDGGRWTDGGASGGEELEPTEFEEAVGDDNLPVDRPPDVPIERPPTARLRNAVVKEVARWLLRAAVQGSPLGRVLNVLDAAFWVRDHYAYIESYYLDGPKYLEQLQADAQRPKPGYDIHHIVERASALEDGFRLWQVDGPENLVRIPTLKHWETTGWFNKRNPAFGGVSPRSTSEARAGTLAGV